MEKMKSASSNSNPLSSSSCLGKAKPERKVIEKNRRIHMKSLCTHLFSLLPSRPYSTTDQEPIPVIDQIDKVIDYIKELKERIEKSKQRKENLTEVRANKRPHGSITNNCCECGSSSLRSSPELQIRETGNALEINLISGLEHYFLFYEIIRIVHEEGLEVVSANYTVVANSIFHVVHAEVRKELYDSGFRAGKAMERINKFITNGSKNTDVVETQTQTQASVWDYDFISNPLTIWDF